MELIQIQTIPQVAMDFMNDVHEEDANLINELYTLVLDAQEDSSNEQKVIEKYQEWFEHTVEHFKGEEVKMLELNFPPYPMHKGEHDQALKTMDNVFRDYLQTKDILKLKYYLSEQLPQWLTHHIQTMDTVTANFFKSGVSPCSAH